MGNIILFSILAIIALVGAIGMVRSQNAIHSALFLILNMLSLAVIYLVLNAPFIAMVQITVYAGAIMVLFLFVIMLLGAEQLRGVGSVGSGRAYLAVVGLSALALLGTLAYTLASGGFAPAGTSQTLDASPTAIGLTLFESYVFPFEITSILLLVAMVGVVVLRTHKEKKNG